MTASLALAALLATGPAGAQDHHLYWGTLHEHSAASRPEYPAEPADLYRAMLLEAALDFGAVSDYDWALAHGAWRDVVLAANRFHCPAGRTGCYDDQERVPGFEDLAKLGERPFVTLLAYEWNNNAPTPEDPDQPEYGHRNVYWLPDDPEADYPENPDPGCTPGGDCLPLVPSGEGEADDREDWETFHDPCALWDGLTSVADAWGGRSQTVPHHPALSVTGWEGEALDGRRHPTSTDPDWSPEGCGVEPSAPVAEGLVELYSVWGGHEHAAMEPLEEPADGLVDPERTVREGLLSLAGPARRLGFVASGDSHHGHPGSDPTPSWQQDPTGAFRGYQFTCALEADCTRRFGHVGLVGVLVPAEGTREDDLDRAGIFAALEARHTVASTGERMDLRLTLVVEGDDRGIQGDDLSASLDLGSVEDASLRLGFDLGERPVEALELIVGDATGAWSVRAVEGVTGEHTATTTVPLVVAGVPEPWLPAGPWLVYARVAAEPSGGLRVPEGAAALPLEDPAGARVLVAAPAGAYTGEELAALLDAQLAASDLDLRLTWDEAEPGRFALAARGPDAVDVTILGNEAPLLAALLGFRDDQDTPCAAAALPCVAGIEVEGGLVQERAWASPIWLRRDEEAGDTGEPAERRCDCAAAPGASLPALLLLPLLTWRRRPYSGPCSARGSR